MSYAVDYALAFQRWYRHPRGLALAFGIFETGIPRSSVLYTAESSSPAGPGLAAFCSGRLSGTIGRWTPIQAA